MVRISDARMSGTSYGTVILHVAPEAAAGGPLALVRDGDMIALDVPARRLELEVDAAELGAATGRVDAADPRLHRPRLPQAVRRPREGCGRRRRLRLPPRSQRSVGPAAGLLSRVPSVLVVGATGALRPAALALADRGDEVYALARPSSRLSGSPAGPASTPCRRTALDGAQLAAALGEPLATGVDAVLVYTPVADEDAQQLVAATARERVVRLLPSAAADPARGPLELTLAGGDPHGHVVLLLGWTDAAAGANGPVAVRWHTPEEISAAAWSRPRTTGGPGIVGRVRPWAERPA